MVVILFAAGDAEGRWSVGCALVECRCSMNNVMTLGSMEVETRMS